MKHSWLSSAWQRIFIAGALLMVLLLGAVPKANALGAGGIIALANAERAAAGLAPLSYNGALSASAAGKAQDMLAKGYWAHTSPDGLAPWTFASRAGYAYVALGENLARDFGSDGGVVAGWMGSVGHRANILSGTYRDIGVAVASGTINGTPTTIVVAHFGATAAAPAPAPVAAPAAKPAPAAPAPKPVAQSPRPTAANTQPAVQNTAEQAPSPAPAAESTEPEKPEPKKPVELLIENLVKIIEPQKPELMST